MQAGVFLSYSRADLVHARTVAEALVRAGAEVWWDAAVRPGDTYDEVTEAALRRAGAVVVLWSPRSTGSRWVRSEAAIAQRLGTLVPAMIEPCERPVMFELVQTTDLSGWTGDENHPGWQALVADVRLRLAGDGPAPPVAGPARPAATPRQGPAILALLPTRELGAAAGHELAPGLAVELAVALGRFPEIGLLAHGEAQLRADYRLEVTLRHAPDRLKVSVALHDAGAGVLLWSSSFSERASALGDPEEAVAEAVSGAVDLALNDHRQRQALEALLSGDEEADLLMAAEARGSEYSPAATLAALDLVSRVLDRAPDRAAALALAGSLHAILAMNGWADDPTAHRARALALAERAVRLSPADEHVLIKAAHALMNSGGAVVEAERLLLRAQTINPVRLVTRFWLALVDTELGRLESALERLDGVTRLNPRAGILPFALLARGHALFGLDRHDEAAGALAEAVRIRPDYPPAHLFLAASLWAAGARTEALAARQRLEALGGKARALAYVSNRDQRRRVHRQFVAMEREAMLLGAA